MCVYYAKKFGHVVRLKGGDPFVFGRGAEELDYIQQFGIKADVVPGISSTVAVPAAAGIPVTKRGVSESYWVITGTTSNGELSRDLLLASQSKATVVLLMGTKKLEEIVRIYEEQGFTDKAIAIIERGTTRDEKIVAGTIIKMVQDAYNDEYLNEKHLVIAATDDKEVNKKVYHDAKKHYLLVNVADTPEYCDFYLGGIVTKGNIKIGISTNGKSPTTAKRLRQLFEEIIPDDINEMVENINKYRDTLKGDFEEKVDALNKLTVGLMKKNKE